MLEFDSLPQASRSLILTKLAWEIVSADCKTIFELAQKRNQTTHEVWRDVCRKAALPLCEMPPQVIARSPHPPPATSGQSMTPGSARTEGAHPVATVSPSKTGDSSSVSRSHRVRNLPVILVIGAVSIVVAGIALFTEASTTGPHRSSQALASRPTDIVRPRVARAGEAIGTDADKPTPEAVVVPPPLGTAKRMDAISKAFSRK